MFKALVVSTVVSMVAGHAKYIPLMPNGGNVAGYKAIGHTDPAGGGARNAFGDAFDKAGKKWTLALCCADSDGDGYTNGVELGDPCCVFTTGKTPQRTADISHPSIATLVPKSNYTCSTGNPCAKALPKLRGSSTA